MVSLLITQLEILLGRVNGIANCECALGQACNFLSLNFQLCVSS